MTYLKDVFGRDMFKDFDKFFVGYDDQFSRMAKMHDDLTKHIPNYPPYNIKKTDENKYTIELAVAGFSKSSIDITLDDDKLIVKGFGQDDQKTADYLFQGIANRAFTRMFALSDQIEVKDAELVNGMLKIFLEKIIPEHKKPKKIEVKDEPSTVSSFAAGNKTLLLEEDDVTESK